MTDLGALLATVFLALGFAAGYMWGLATGQRRAWARAEELRKMVVGHFR